MQCDLSAAQPRARRNPACGNKLARRHAGVLALALAVVPGGESRSQEAGAGVVELPPVVVAVDPPKKKYPAVTVAKKSKPSSRPVAAPAPVVPQQTPATESFDGLTLTIPGIAVVGDIELEHERGLQKKILNLAFAATKNLAREIIENRLRRRRIEDGVRDRSTVGLFRQQHQSRHPTLGVVMQLF